MQQTPQLCVHCGAANPLGARFCAFCGQAGIGATAKSVTGMLPSTFLLKQRYQIVDRIGQGGFGSVYKAEDGQFGHAPRAIKEMSVSSLDPSEVAEATEAFKQEAMLLANLMHPNLPRIYDHFEEQGHWYLVMDFVEGETLEDRLAKAAGGHFALTEVIQLGLQLCDVLGYLHGHRPPIIFRDLKPANVMVTQDNHLYLVDFGIARLFKPGQAKDTRVLGSPGYAAPEQYGRAQTTERADIYSLGASLHQFISGRDPSDDPFQFPTLRLEQYGARGQSLATLVMSMVEMNKDRRPANVREVRDELLRIAQLPLQSVASANMSQSASAAPTRSFRTLIVEPGGSKLYSYPTINEALQVAVPGMEIRVRPGTYVETVVFDKAVNLFGDGQRENIILQGSIVVQADHGTIQDLTIFNTASNAYAVDIPRGAVNLVNCDISSSGWACVAIHNAATQPLIQNCRIRDGKQGGIYVFSGAKGTIENCEIFANETTGVEVTTGADPLIRRCKMYKNKQYGAFVHGKGSGVFEDCELYGNGFTGIEIITEGGPVLRRCNLHDSQRDGARVQSRGQGVFEDCNFFTNAFSGIVVAAGGNPRLLRCKMHNNREYGALVNQSGLGSFQACEFYANFFSGMGVEEAGNPHVVGSQFRDGKQNGVLVSQKGQGIFENCLFYANTFPGMGIATEGDPQVRGCRFYDSQKSGAYVFDKGKGSFDRCEFFANTLSGLVITTNGAPVVTRCRFHDGLVHGVVVSDNGIGTFEDCEFAANARAGLEIHAEGNPSLFRCQFSHNQGNGVQVRDRGQGRLIDCQFVSNRASGLECTRQGNPFCYRCLIKNNHHYGVWVHIDGRGTFEECTMRENAAGSWNIQEGCTVQLRKNIGPPPPL